MMREGLVEGSRLRDEGMARVLKGEPDGEKLSKEFNRVFARTVRSGQKFTALTVRRAMPKGLEPRHCNWWSAKFGALIRDAIKRREVKRVGMTRSISPPAHARMLIVYQGTDRVYGF